MQAAAATLVDPRSSEEQRRLAQQFINSQLDVSACLEILQSTREGVLCSLAHSKLTQLLVASMHQGDATSTLTHVNQVISSLPPTPQILHLRALIFKISLPDFGGYLSSSSLAVAVLDEVDPFTCSSLGAPLQYHVQVLQHFGESLLAPLVAHLASCDDFGLSVPIISRLLDWPHGDLRSRVAFPGTPSNSVMPQLSALLPVLVRASTSSADRSLRGAARGCLALMVDIPGGFPAALQAMRSAGDVGPPEFYPFLTMISCMLKSRAAEMTGHFSTIATFAVACVALDDCRGLAVEVGSMLPPAMAYSIFSRVVSVLSGTPDSHVLAAMQLQSDFSELVEDSSVLLARRCPVAVIQSFLQSISSSGAAVPVLMLALCGCFLGDQVSGENPEIPAELRDDQIAAGVVMLLQQLHSLLISNPNNPGLLWVFERCAPIYLFNAPQGPYELSFGRNPTGIRFLDSLVGVCLHSDKLLCNLATTSRIVGHLCRSKSWPRVLAECGRRLATLPLKARKLALRALVASGNGLKTEAERRQFFSMLLAPVDHLVEVMSALGATSSKSRAIVGELFVGMLPRVLQVINSVPQLIARCCKGSVVVLQTLPADRQTQCALALLQVALSHRQLEPALHLCQLLAEGGAGFPPMLADTLSLCSEQLFASERPIRALCLSTLAACFTAAAGGSSCAPPVASTLLRWALLHSTETVELQWTLECTRHSPELQQPVMASMASNPLWTRSLCRSASPGADWVSLRLEHSRK